MVKSRIQRETKKNKEAEKINPVGNKEKNREGSLHPTHHKPGQKRHVFRPFGSTSKVGAI